VAEIKHEVLPLFSIPLYKSELSPLDPLTYQKLINHEWEKNEGFVTHVETAERHLLDRPEYKGLKQAIQIHIDHFAYEVIGSQRDLCWEITTSWVNRSVNGDYHTSHWHSNSLISGVFYINTNPDSGAIVFHKDKEHKNLWGDTLRIDWDKETDYNTEAVGILPKTNQLLMFPSILAHSVLTNTSNDNRYSLAFNVFPRGTFGKGGNSEVTL
jgi:uncharacterized protein (TIGR02466 family)